MLQLLREFKVGRPQVFAGLMLLAFLAQCLWAAKTRAVADLEYRYIAAGLPSAETSAEIKTASASPLTGWVAALPVRTIPLIRKVASAPISEALAVPRPAAGGPPADRPEPALVRGVAALRLPVR